MNVLPAAGPAPCPPHAGAAVQHLETRQGPGEAITARNVALSSSRTLLTHTRQTCVQVTACARRVRQSAERAPFRAPQSRTGHVPAQVIMVSRGPGHPLRLTIVAVRLTLGDADAPGRRPFAVRCPADGRSPTRPAARRR